MSKGAVAVAILRWSSRLAGALCLVIAVTGAFDGTAEGRHTAWIFGGLGALLLAWSLHPRLRGPRAGSKC